MDDEKRLAALLDLAKQHMERCRQLEEIEWRINFSVWALLGGIAYLWGNGHVKSPAWIQSRWALIVFPLSVMFIHGWATVWFWFRHRSEARLRDGYRRDISTLLGTKKDYPDRGLTLRDVLWMIWHWVVTLTLAAAVILIMQNVVIPSK